MIKASSKLDQDKFCYLDFLAKFNAVNHQRIFLIAAALLCCLLAVSAFFTLEGFRHRTEQKSDVFITDRALNEEVCNEHFYFSTATATIPYIGLSKINRIDCQNKTGVSLQRTVVSVSKPIPASEVAIDTENLKALNSNASLNLMIENYTVRRSSNNEGLDCDDFTYELIVETFSTTVEAFKAGSESAFAEGPSDPVQNQGFFTRLSQYFSGRSSKASA